MAHLFILFGILLLENIRLCKLVQEAPLSASPRLHMDTLLAGKVIAVAKVKGSKVPCRVVKVFKPPMHDKQTGH